MVSVVKIVFLCCNQEKKDIFFDKILLKTKFFLFEICIFYFFSEITVNTLDFLFNNKHDTAVETRAYNTIFNHK